MMKPVRFILAFIAISFCLHSRSAKASGPVRCDVALVSERQMLDELAALHGDIQKARDDKNPVMIGALSRDYQNKLRQARELGIDLQTLRSRNEQLANVEAVAKAEQTEKLKEIKQSERALRHWANAGFLPKEIADIAAYARSQSGSTLAFLTKGRKHLIVLDETTRTVLKTINLKESFELGDLRYSPDGSKLLLTTVHHVTNQRVREKVGSLRVVRFEPVYETRWALYDIDGTPLAEFKRPGRVLDVNAFSSNEPEITAAFEDGHIEKINIEQAQFQRMKLPAVQRTKQARFSPDGKKLLSLFFDNLIGRKDFLSDLANAQPEIPKWQKLFTKEAKAIEPLSLEVAKPEWYAEDKKAPIFTPDQKLFLRSGSGRYAEVYDADTGAFIKRIGNPDASLYWIVDTDISADGSTALIVYGNGIELIDMHDFSVLQTIRSEEPAVGDQMTLDGGKFDSSNNFYVWSRRHFTQFFRAPRDI